MFDEKDIPADAFLDEAFDVEPEPEPIDLDNVPTFGEVMADNEETLTDDEMFALSDDESDDVEYRDRDDDEEIDLADDYYVNDDGEFEYR